MSGERYRLVTIQDGREFISSVVMGRDEVLDHLEAEAALHQLGGWKVKQRMPWKVGNRLPPGWEFPELHMSKRGITRIVFAKRFEPMEDQREKEE